MYRGSAWLAASRQAWAVWTIVFVQYLQLILASQAQVASNVLRSQSDDTLAPSERGGQYSYSVQAISDTCSLMMTKYLQQPACQSLSIHKRMFSSVIKRLIKFGGYLLICITLIISKSRDSWHSDNTGSVMRVSDTVMQGSCRERALGHYRLTGPASPAYLASWPLEDTGRHL